MTTLIFGANGQLGQELMSLRPKPDDVIGYTKKELDITNKDNLERIFDQQKPEFVINAAAYTNVDGAEDNEEIATVINGHAVGYLAQMCKKYDTYLIHISTDYVFNGLSKRGYKENDPINPINAYGRSKALGEKLIQEINPRFVIIRTAWVYGSFGHNFVKTMLKLAKTKNTLSVVDNQYGCPTYAADLAEMIFHIINHPSIIGGIYHYTGKGKTSWFLFAQEIFNILHKDYDNLPEVIPVDNFPARSKRPTYSVLNCKKIEQNFNEKCLDWKKSLKKCIYKILETQGY